MRKSSILLRLLAFFIDCTLLSFLGAVVFAAAFAGYSASGGLLGLSQALRLMSIAFLSSTLLFLFYFTYLTMAGERTIGKRIVGLRVVRQDGSPLGFGQAFARCLIHVIALPFWPVSLLTAFLCDGRMVHDIMTGTRVINTDLHSKIAPKGYPGDKEEATEAYTVGTSTS
ncbi:RDD family protein [Syntrophorhabdus aromaticivorans]|uniref:RDD family protein n=1 Tax=Syntrophorhabdus aromaticivorans TaxID=328301 RepID=UPI0003F89502|nr:RDD family protein [Syntrophorhabdus aromaticivorans]